MSTTESTLDRNGTVGRTPRTQRVKLVSLGTLAVGLVVWAVGSVFWLPIIVPDSLMYLDHSQDLLGTGLIQVGFRQFGYPLWLAAMSGIGHLTTLDPLWLTVVAQRLLLIAAIAATIYVLRWWAAPLTFVLLLPSTIAYTDFILTEAIAIPIAVLAASACVASFHATEKRPMLASLATAAIAGSALPMIRLHYGILTVAVAVAIAVATHRRDAFRRWGVVWLSVVVISSSLLIVALSLENRAENGILYPSLGSERVLFWSTWVTIVPGHRDDVARALPDVYLDGSPDAFILAIDNSGRSFDEQRAAYAAATRAIFDVTGESLNIQRLRSFAGVFAGARIDDLGPVLFTAAQPSMTGEASLYIHQYGAVASVDPEMIARRYNDESPARPVLMISTTLRRLVPPMPYVGNVMLLIVPLTMLASIYLVQFSESRFLAALSVSVLLGYALASSLFVMDNLRYLIPAYAFALVITSGAARQHWSASSPTARVS